MKKIILSTLLATFTISAQASDYPAECKELIELNAQAMELIPEMKQSLPDFNKDKLIEESIQEWNELDEAGKKEAHAACVEGVKLMKQAIEAVKAAK